MRVSSKNHDGIIVIDIHPEKGDDVGSCLWMRVYLDPEHGQLLSASDIGDYSHRWPETGKEFLKLMTQVDKGYLMKKCCSDRKEYDADDITKSIEDYFKDFSTEDEEEWESLQNFLENIKGCSNVYEIQKEFDDTSFDYGDAWECIRATYTPWQKRWAGYFCKYVVPEVRKWVSLWEDDADETGRR